MRRALLLLALAALGATGAVVLTGCGDKPSTPIAPDVKEPDNRNLSGEEILRRKQAADAGHPVDR